MCHCQSTGMEPNPSTVLYTANSSLDDRVRDLLSPFNLPALPTGGSKVRLIAIGHRTSVTDIISRIHHCGVPVPMWTPAQPIPNTDEVVRIYSENRSV
jgi:hypothetical protein